jgi:hypothetical protein
MMKPLRKRHLQVWTALAVLLPLGIISAWLYAPNTVPVKLLDKEQAALLPVTVQTKESKSYTGILRTNEQKAAWQLEWQNKTPLTVPSAVIYRKISNDNGIIKNELVGRIESKGNYVFNINTGSSNNSAFSFVLYDFIHDKIIDSLNF